MMHCYTPLLAAAATVCIGSLAAASPIASDQWSTASGGYSGNFAGSNPTTGVSG